MSELGLQTVRNQSPCSRLGARFRNDLTDSSDCDTDRCSDATIVDRPSIQTLGSRRSDGPTDRRPARRTAPGSRLISSVGAAPSSHCLRPGRPVTHGSWERVTRQWRRRASLGVWRRMPVIWWSQRVTQHGGTITGSCRRPRPQCCVCRAGRTSTETRTVTGAESRECVRPESCAAQPGMIQ